MLIISALGGRDREIDPTPGACKLATLNELGSSCVGKRAVSKKRVAVIKKDPH